MKAKELNSEFEESWKLVLNSKYVIMNLKYFTNNNDFYLNFNELEQEIDVLGLKNIENK